MRFRRHEPEGDESFWREDRRAVRFSDSPVVNLLGASIVVLAVGTLVGLAVLWPHGKLHTRGHLGPVRTYAAVVERTQRVPCVVAGITSCRAVSVKLLDGPDKHRTIAMTTAAETGTLPVHDGDRIRVYKNTPPPGGILPSTHYEKYSFGDFDRRGSMLWLALAFVVLLLATGRFHGARALLGLGASLAIVVEFVVPAILHGSSPIAVALVGSLAVMLVSMPLSYGLGAKAMAAWLGTAVSLALAAGLADTTASIAHLTGASSDESVYLAASQAQLSLKGLLIAGMVIGSLGVLLDLTVSQASTVIALRRANPSLGFGQLFRGALEVGHDHIAATVNTLVFAYAGASLPVLLIFSVGGTSFTDAVNGEAVAVEVIAALVGSIGLIASMPITTALAALLAQRMSDRQLEAAHAAHAH